MQYFSNLMSNKKFLTLQAIYLHFKFTFTMRGAYLHVPPPPPPRIPAILRTKSELDYWQITRTTKMLHLNCNVIDETIFISITDPSTNH